MIIERLTVMAKGHVFYPGSEAQYVAQQFAVENNTETIAIVYLGTQEWYDEIKTEKDGWSRAEMWDRIGRSLWENMSHSFAYSAPLDQQGIYISIELAEYKQFHKYRHGHHSADILNKIEHPNLKSIGKTVHVIFV